jgi:hypothetical protein
MSLTDHRETVWAWRELHQMAARDQRQKGAVPVRSWRIRFWAWVSRVSHRKLLNLTVRHRGGRIARFTARSAAERSRIA